MIQKKVLKNTLIEILKLDLLAFSTNKLVNSFWESQGFKDRNDLVYRNKSLNYNNI